MPGAKHVDEIHALFATFDALRDADGVPEPSDPEETRAITEAMHSHWVAFASTG